MNRRDLGESDRAPIRQHLAGTFAERLGYTPHVLF